MPGQNSDFYFFRDAHPNLRLGTASDRYAGWIGQIYTRDYLFLKVPQVIFARTLWQGGKQVENKNYLNPEMFINRFYDPANAILGDDIAGFVFEQEYHRKTERIPPKWKRPDPGAGDIQILWKLAWSLLG